MVVNNVGPYEIWAGNPAVFIRKRFNDEIIKQLLSSKWWDKEDILINSSMDVQSPHEFLKHYDMSNK